jgi:pyruvate dehydrogenase E2 component (dihydrolipoamide acetyltransferase)
MDILMPQLGETVTEGKITSWLRAVGDTIAHGDVLFEIETDKASMEVEATAAGRIAQILVQAGDTAPIGALVAVIAEGAEQAVQTPAAAAAASAVSAADSPAPKPVTEPTPIAAPRELDPFNAVQSPPKNFGPATLDDGTQVTPLARRLASTAGVDLKQLNGSGPQGRIVGKDVLPGGSSARNSAASPLKPAGSGTSVEQVKATYQDVPHVEVELDGMRRTIAKRLVESKQTVPHFYLTIDVNIDKLLELRKVANAALPQKLSVNDFVVKAFALALSRVPLANAIWAEDRLLRFSRVDVGIAVAVEGGLFTPVVRDAGTKSLTALAADIRDLAQRARDRKLKPQEYQGGAASVSNLGMFGVREFSAIINAPQSTILAVGAAERRPVEAPDGSVRFAGAMTVTLSCDHRVVDGALGAELLAAFKKIIEEPILTLI